jgi:DNA-binding transcriptional ArsR family regulator
VEAGTELLAVGPDVAERLRGEVAEPLEEQAERAGALADPTRLGIARAVQLGQELCVADIAWIVQRPEKLVSHHLRLLRTHRILASRREGKMVMYSLSPPGAQLLDAVLGASEGREARLRAVG